jgi:hypothetical protein
VSQDVAITQIVNAIITVFYAVVFDRLLTAHKGEPRGA